ncbi:MAG TPA: sugar diacid recognition domain-containing protein [Symbiobacteriaceae bacterium]|nr:sugar diacid recognition domain-containing protein [Symbiobacteriaceae bacterium]
MLLTPELAQPIVDRAMAILQRNVNIMDANGVIVGSGDPSRIGTLHQGAEAVLRTGKRLEIQPEDVPKWGGVRIGVNLPLRLGRSIVGVVGITGLPDEVRPFGELIREMVQLMLVQVRSAELERTSALAREALLRDLLTGTGDLTERMVREATLLGLNRETLYTVMLCEPQAGVEPGDYTWLDPMAGLIERSAAEGAIEPLLMTGPWEGRLVVVAGPGADGLLPALQGLLPAGAAIAAGLSVRGLHELRRSYRTAMLAMQAGRRLRGEGAFTAGALYLETMLAGISPDDGRTYVHRVLGGLPPATSKAGAQLRETVTAFIKADLSLATAAGQLGIHRHTLMYRLEQVAGATGLDPRGGEGAVRFYLALMLEQLYGPNVQSESD